MLRHIYGGLIIMFSKKVKLMSLFYMVNCMDPKAQRHNLHIFSDSWRGKPRKLGLEKQKPDYF